MGNNIFLKSLRIHFFTSFSMLEKIIELCPDDLWNCKKSGFVFWNQLIHTFAGMYVWLREEEMTSIPFSQVNGKNVPVEFEKDPDILLTKEEIIQCCKETKEIVEKWFDEKDDDWLKLPYKPYNKITNFDITAGQIRHLMYHIGHCEAIFRENGIDTGEYLDYYG